MQNIMEKSFEYVTTRLNMTLGGALAWCKGEELLGLKNSLFICENGKLSQYVNEEEGDKFYNMVKNLTEDKFNKICDEFVESVEKKDLIMMHKGLAIFDELDNFPELVATNDVLIRLKRIRKATHEEAYKIKTKDNRKDFIIFKGKIYV